MVFSSGTSGGFIRLFYPSRNIPVLAVDGDEIGGKAYYRACSDRCFQMRRAGFIRLFLDRFQNGKVLCRIRRSCTLFDFDRIDRAVLMDDQIDVSLIFRTVFSIVLS
nr:hypothetical protein [Ruminococcus sp.]